MKLTGCHDVPGARDAGLHLGEGAARERHGLLQQAGVDIAGVCGLAQAVGRHVGVFEDGGVDLGLWVCVSAVGSGLMGKGLRRTDIVIRARQRDDASLDSKGCSVAAGVASDNIDSAVGGYHAHGGEGEEEGLGKHLDWFRVCVEEESEMCVCDGGWKKGEVFECIVI